MGGKTLIIRQVPIAQPRPRVTRFGTFDPAKEFKAFAKLQMIQQVEETLDCPIEMEVFFYLPIPKATSKKKHALMLSNEIKHQKVKDIDNMLKYLFDVMNEIVFKDDKQIWNIKAQKLYSDDPRTEIILTW